MFMSLVWFTVLVLSSAAGAGAYWLVARRGQHVDPPESVWFAIFAAILVSGLAHVALQYAVIITVAASDVHH